MNNSRRKKINQSILSLTGAQERMQKALDEEKAALDRVPDDDEHEEMRDAMDEVITGLEDALSSLGEALDTLNGADF